MKKKIAILLLLVLVMTFTFAGCNMVTLNQDADDAIVVAHVNYKPANLTDTVTKKELKEMFATQGQIYIYYYGWSYEKTYDFCVEALAQQKLVKLKALDELCKIYNEAHPEDKVNPASIITVDIGAVDLNKRSENKTIFDDILSIDERLSVIKNYNQQLKDAIDELIKEIEKEELLNKPHEDKPDEDKEEEEEIKDKPAIRETRPADEKEDPDIKLDAEYSDKELADKQKELNELKKFEISWKAEIEELRDKVKAAEGDEKERLQKELDHKEEAFNRLSRRLDKAKKSRDEIFEDLVDSMLVSHYRRQMIYTENLNGSIDNNVEKATLNKENEIIIQNKNDFIVESPLANGSIERFLSGKYESAIKGGAPVYYHPIVDKPLDSRKDKSEGELGSAGYGFTFNILFNFNKNDAEILKQLKAKADQTGNSSDKALYEAKKAEFAENIRVNISNPNYDPSKKCASNLTKEQLEEKNEDGTYKYKDKYGYHKCDDPNCPLKPFGYTKQPKIGEDGRVVMENDKPVLVDIKEIYGDLLTDAEYKDIEVGYGIRDDENNGLKITTVLKMINFDLSNINKDYKAKIDAELDPEKKLDLEFKKQIALREMFISWMYKVNDDPGMFSKDNARGYMVPKAGESSYVDTYTDQSRALMGADLSDAKNPTYANPTYNKGNKHFVGNYATTDIPTTAKDFKDFGSMMAISEFGVHIIMISEMPGYYQDGEQILMKNAPFTYGRYDYTLVSDSFKDSVRTYIESKIYQKGVKDIIDNYDKYVRTDKNAYKGLYED